MNTINPAPLCRFCDFGAVMHVSRITCLLTYLLNNQCPLGLVSVKHHEIRSSLAYIWTQSEMAKIPEGCRCRPMISVELVRTSFAAVI